MVAPFLLGALAILLALAFWRPGAGILVAVLLLLFLPGRWWRWRTRHFRRGVRRLKRGDTARARSEFERFLHEIERDDRIERWQPVFNLGRRYSYAGAAHSNIGVTWLHEGQPRKALHHFEIARRLDDGSAQAVFGEAAARRRLGQLRKGEATAERAVELRPGYLPARLLLAAIRRERGDAEGAEEALRPLAEEGRDIERLTRDMLAQWPDAPQGKERADEGTEAGRMVEREDQEP